MTTNASPRDNNARARSRNGLSGNAFRMSGRHDMHAAKSQRLR